MSHPQAPVAAIAAAPSIRPRPQGKQLLWLLVPAVIVIASLSATVTQLASKRGASAALDPSGKGQVAYAAGWPLTFARVSRTRLTAAAWNRLVDGPPPVRAIAPLAFVTDVVILATIFAAVLGLTVGLWWLALQPKFHRKMKPAQLGQHITTGLAIAASWYVLAVSIITILSHNAATDAVVREQITRPLALVALAPGVAGYAVQRWLETDSGPSISLTGGPAGIVAALAALVIGVALSAGALTVLILLVARHRMRPSP